MLACMPQIQGPSLLENVGETKLHHVHSTVLRPFCTTRKTGENYGNYMFWRPWPKCPSGYAHGGGTATGTVQWCYI